MACVSIAPVPLYRVATLLLLSAIQNGCPGWKAMPQGFCRLASIVVALATTLLLSDTRALSVKSVTAGAVIWLALPPPPPPPQAAMNVLTRPSAAAASVLLLMTR